MKLQLQLILDPLMFSWPTQWQHWPSLHHFELSSRQNSHQWPECLDWRHLLQFPIPHSRFPFVLSSLLNLFYFFNLTLSPHNQALHCYYWLDQTALQASINLQLLLPVCQNHTCCLFSYFSPWCKNVAFVNFLAGSYSLANLQRCSFT